MRQRNLRPLDRTELTAVQGGNAPRQLSQGEREASYIVAATVGGALIGAGAGPAGALIVGGVSGGLATFRVMQERAKRALAKPPAPRY